MSEMSAVREWTYLVPQNGTLISKADLGMILLSIVQKMGYDRPTDDQKKAVEAFVFGKDVFISLPTGSGKSPCAIPACHMFSMNCEDDMGPGNAWSTIPSSWLCQHHLCKTW